MSVFFCRGRNAGDSFVASFIRTPNPVTRTSNILDTRIRTAVSARAEQHLLDRPAVAHQRRQRRRPLRLRAQPPQHIPDPYRRVRGSRLSPRPARCQPLCICATLPRTAAGSYRFGHRVGGGHASLRERVDIGRVRWVNIVHEEFLLVSQRHQLQQPVRILQSTRKSQLPRLLLRSMS